MKSKNIYQSRAGRYAHMSIEQLEKLERKHINTIDQIDSWDGYYQNRDVDRAKAVALLREVRAEREAKILQYALL